VPHLGASTCVVGGAASKGANLNSNGPGPLRKLARPWVAKTSTLSGGRAYWAPPVPKGGSMASLRELLPKGQGVCERTVAC
jgi:hypothetical protein